MLCSAPRGAGADRGNGPRLRPVYPFGGPDTDTLVRDGDGWRITAKVLTVTWEEGTAS